MSERAQSYPSHRRWHPIFHFFAVPILAINIIVKIVQAVRVPSLETAWEVIIAIVLLVTVVLARWYALKVQNRLIRLEERLRLQRCLPEDLRSRIDELRTSQLIALRFCADDELPELTRAILTGELRDRKAIKQRIRNWRADWLRV